MADEVAPQNGGAPEGGVPAGLYDEFLSSVPESARDLVAPALHEYNRSKVEPMVRENAEFRKRFEPLEGIDGLDQVPPEDLQGLIQFHQIASDPEQFLQWYGSAAPELAQAYPDEFQSVWEQMGQQLGYFDPAEEEGGQASPEVQQLQEQIQQMQETLQGFIGQNEQQSRAQAADGAIDEQLQKIAEQNGEPLDEDTVQRVLRHAHGFVDDSDEPVIAAWEDLQAFRGGAQSELVDQKLNQPAGANSGGRPDTTPEAYSFNDPKLKEAARARLTGANAV